MSTCTYDGLLRMCDIHPLEDAPRLVAADWQEENGGTVVAESLRLVHETLRSRLGGVMRLSLPALDAFPAYHSGEPPLAGLRQLEAETKERGLSGDELRRRYLDLFSTNIGLNAKNLLPSLRLQYHQQVALLASLGLLEERTERSPTHPHLVESHQGITAVDGNWYELPTLLDIFARLQAPEMQTKMRQGFDTLLLVPFGLGLERMIEAWTAGVNRNATIVPEIFNFKLYQGPLYVKDEYLREPLVYDPRSFTHNHGGRNKEEILTQDNCGWEVLLVEGFTDIPQEGQGRTIGGRRQVECGQTPDEYLASMPEDEVGWTPEAYVIRFLDAVECSNTVLDRRTYTDLVGAYLPSSRFVPRARWGPGDCLSGLDWNILGYSYPNCGARYAVRVAVATSPSS